MSDIQKIIADYLSSGKCDRHARSVLDCIRSEPKALKAIKAIAKNDDGKIRQVIQLCLDAELQARTAGDLLKLEREIVPPRQAVETLKDFLDQLSKYAAHPLVASLDDELSKHTDRPLLGWTADDVAADRNALDHIAMLIDDWEHQVAQDTRTALGVTREALSGVKPAAIGRLADAVAHLAGKPFTKHVVALAEIALGIDTVTTTQVSETLRSRRRLGVGQRDKEGRELVRWIVALTKRRRRK